MKIIESFKKQSRIMQILNIILIICIIYEIILVSFNMPFNGAVTILMGVILWIDIFKYLLN